MPLQCTTVQWSITSSVQLYFHWCTHSPFHSGKVLEAVAEPGVRKRTESSLGGREIKYYGDPPDVWQQWRWKLEKENHVFQRQDVGKCEAFCQTYLKPFSYVNLAAGLKYFAKLTVSSFTPIQSPLSSPLYTFWWSRIFQFSRPKSLQVFPNQSFWEHGAPSSKNDLINCYLNLFSISDNLILV